MDAAGEPLLYYENRLNVDLAVNRFQFSQLVRLDTGSTIQLGLFFTTGEKKRKVLL